MVSHAIHKNKFNRGGFTLAELLVSLMVMAIILTAVATLASAMDLANEATKDIGEKQAQIRLATVRISELIRNCKLVLGLQDNRLAIWRKDDNGDSKMNPSELTFIEIGSGRDYIRMMEYDTAGSPPWFETSCYTDLHGFWDGYASAHEWLGSNGGRENYVAMVSECSNVRYALDTAPPNTKRVTILFEVEEDSAFKTYQISTSLRGRSVNLINPANPGSLIWPDDD